MRVVRRETISFLALGRGKAPTLCKGLAAGKGKLSLSPRGTVRLLSPSPEPALGRSPWGCRAALASCVFRKPRSGRRCRRG